MTRPRGRIVDVLRLIGLFWSAVAIRALPWRSVFDEGRVYFEGNDAYYHARRILYSVIQFPDFLRSDPYINYPHGGQAIWSPLFDGGLAWLVHVTLGSPDEGTLARLLVWVPPVLGGAAVVATYLLTRKVFGEVAAWIAACLLALLPAHFSYSQIGFVDHHVAVALVSVVLLACGMHFVDSGASQARGWRREGRVALALGLALGGALLLWPGMLLHVALLEAAFLMVLVSQASRSEAGFVAGRLAAAHGLAFALVAPLSIGVTWRVWGDFSPVVTSSFQPWFFACLCAYFGCYFALCRRLGERLSPGQRTVIALASALGVLLASALFVSELSAGLGDAWKWFTKRESFQATVAESKPLLFQGTRFSLAFAERTLSRFIYLFPLVMGLAWSAFRRHAQPAPRLLLVWWAGALFAATLLQTRFFNSLSIPWAMLAGWGASEALSWASSRLRGLREVRWKRWALHLSTPAVFVWVLWPCFAEYRRYLVDQLHWIQGRALVRTHVETRKRLLVDLASWLRENTPTTSGFVEPDMQPEYAVLSNWADGHVLTYEARRPTVVNNFGDDIGRQNLVLSELYYRVDEDQASRILDRLGARYVIFEYRKTRSRVELSGVSMNVRLFFYDGEEGEESSAFRFGKARRIERSVSAVRRHRLVYETEPKPHASNPQRSGFKLYEHVAGARLRGLAPAGARVEARLALTTNRGRSIDFVSSTRADDGGRYELRLPYSNVGSPPAVRSADQYEVRSAGQVRRAVLYERDVLEGREVAGPDFAAPAVAAGAGRGEG
ncbi:MAG: STT3 domain-containing protein [Myxococcota bacterium]